jgi:hypothetical protein
MEALGRGPTMLCMTTTASPARPRLVGRPARSTRASKAHRTSLYALAWTALFIVWHGYWALGGNFGFGDQEAAIPDTTSSASGLVFTVAVAGMFVAGIAVPLAGMRGWGPRRLLTALLWAGAAILAARGFAGLADDGLRFSGLAERGLSGLTDEQVLDSAHPSAYTIWSTVGIDAFFSLGALLFARAAHAAGPLALLRRRPHMTRSLGWAAYAASGWAAAYAIGVRGYQGLGGMEGLPGTFKDPAGMQRASLVAGGVILLVAVGALALVRPWGLRLPRQLVIVPALAGSAFAIAHALTAYITKTLQLLGVVHLDFRGWAQLDVGALIRWDLLFYEPWFVGLGILVTLGALHHHRRTGGSTRGARRLLLGTGAGTIAITALACTMVLT